MTSLHRTHHMKTRESHTRILAAQSCSPGFSLYLKCGCWLKTVFEHQCFVQCGEAKYDTISLETICKLVLLAKRYRCWQGEGEERRRATRLKRNFGSSPAARPSGTCSAPPPPAPDGQNLFIMFTLTATELVRNSRKAPDILKVTAGGSTMSVYVMSRVKCSR